MTREEQKSAEQISAGIVAYHRAFAAGDYKSAIGLMGPAMSVYAPYGVLQFVPEGDKENVFQVYQDLHEQGARLCVEPRYVNVQVSGDMAVATFINEGFGIAPNSGEKRFEVCRRMTQVWTRADNRWTIAHMHASTLDTTRNFEELALA